jgi:carotenoid cleavage dioxygenase-like enzyme
VQAGELEIPAAPRRVMPSSMLSRGDEDVHAAPRALTLAVVGGRRPEGLGGHLFVSGSIAARGRPAFAGEGVLVRVDLGAPAVRLTAAVLRPPCFHADHRLRGGEHGRLLRFHDLGLARISPRLGARTVLGTAPVFLRDRMIVTTDVGRAWEVDPVSLELVTPIGRIDEWRGALPTPWPFGLVLSSAHPAVDTGSGELFTVNYAPAWVPGAFARLVRWRGAGALEHFKLSVDGKAVAIAGVVHQVGLDRHHVVVQDGAFHVELGHFLLDAVDVVVPGAPMRRLFRGPTRAHAPTTVLYVVPRAGLGRGGTVDAPATARAVRVELPGESVHFEVQAGDDPETVTVVVPHTPTLDVSRWIRRGERMLDGSRAEDMTGLPVPCALVPGELAVHTIDARTGATREVRRIGGEAMWGLGLAAHAPIEGPIAVAFHNTSGFFPELIPADVARACAGRVDVAALAGEGRLPRLLAIDVGSGAVASWTCPNGWALLSPCFVPRSEDSTGRAGFVVCVAHAAAEVPRTPGSSGEELWVFDAEDVGRGPICRLGHPELDFAFTVHAGWTATLRPSPRDYVVSTAEELARRGRTGRMIAERVLPRSAR